MGRVFPTPGSASSVVMTPFMSDTSVARAGASVAFVASTPVMLFWSCALVNGDTACAAMSVRSAAIWTGERPRFISARVWSELNPVATICARTGASAVEKPSKSRGSAASAALNADRAALVAGNCAARSEASA